MPRTLFCFERLSIVISGNFYFMLGRRRFPTCYRLCSISDEREILRMNEKPQWFGKLIHMLGGVQSLFVTEFVKIHDDENSCHD